VAAQRIWDLNWFASASREHPLILKCL
jgi:hypothetical protein